MSKDFKYSPIADQKDFKDAKTYDAWHDFVKGFFEDEVTALKQAGIQYPQFYSEVDLPSTPPVVSKLIKWDAFPLVVQTRKGGRNPDAFKDCATLVGGYRQNYDEYCELFVHYDGKGNIKKIEVTSEPPEYYDLMYENEKETLLELYQKHISPDVKLEDLEANSDDIFAYLSTVTGRNLTPASFGKPANTKIYNMWNKWNTTHGAMHLHQINNFLSAEVDIAAQATALRSNYGKQVTEPITLCKYASYGNSGRNSDPSIGISANNLASQGVRITVQNPVGLYIKNVAYQGLTKGHKTVENPEKYLKMTRGKEGYGLRYVFEVPENEGFVSDFEANGNPIKYGPELLLLFQIGITALAVKAEHGTQAPLPFGGHLPEAVPLPRYPATTQVKAQNHANASVELKKAARAPLKRL